MEIAFVNVDAVYDSAAYTAEQVRAAIEEALAKDEAVQAICTIEDVLCDDESEEDEDNA